MDLERSWRETTTAADGNDSRRARVDEDVAQRRTWTGARDRVVAEDLGPSVGLRPFNVEHVARRTHAELEGRQSSTVGLTGRIKDRVAGDVGADRVLWTETIVV